MKKIQGAIYLYNIQLIYNSLLTDTNILGQINFLKFVLQICAVLKPNNINNMNGLLVFLKTHPKSIYTVQQMQLNLYLYL